MSEALIISGPCAAESREQVLTTARQLAKVGVSIFRAGVWKPRTEPGSFEGVGEQALEWLAEAQAETGIPAATEVATPEHVRLAINHGLRVLWLGARTTTNPFLVQQIADEIHHSSFTNLQILIKNPVSPDVRLWKGAIERIRKAGVKQVYAVHRGFQTGQPSPYRNAPVWSVPFALKLEKPDVPLLLDPSHMAGDAALVPELSRQAMRLGYNGLMIESHCAPAEARSDRNQQLTPAQLEQLIQSLPVRQSSAEDGLSELRQRLDETDDTLFLLLLQRMQISRQIGDYKRKHNLPILQEKRYAELLDRRLRWARDNRLDEATIRRILDAIHEESCRWQL
ncbi:MAG: bifunctional 3-deoxy-7-phosphoheptulonate synthase/chorismate mutase type II [Paludibacteraceae bacterium]|nr:bifunctional 3-deoxy-7-phosphoheptulonate synthase/chorismate mutase type II [Paludibacteraceae bacterium]